MPEHITAYKMSDIRSMAGLILATILIALMVWFGVRLQISNLLSEITPLNEPHAGEIAKTARSLSPLNPRARWLQGAVSQKNLDQESVDNAMASFVDAARLSPFHFRWWIEAGRAQERSGNFDAAEKAYRRAVELAPDYTSPRWQLGNFYLRRGNNEQAIAELVAAAKHSAAYRGQVYSMAWNFFGNDVRALEQFANDDPGSRTSLALFYASQNRPDDALRNWNMLGSEQKTGFLDEAEAAAKALLKHHSYAAASEFSRQSGIDSTARNETITNGDFELPIKARDLQMFDWVAVKRDAKLEIALDGRVKSSGGRSLRLVFRGYASHWLDSVSQTVVVVPGQKYRVSFTYRTEELRGGSLPRFEVFGIADNIFISGSPPMASGTSDWQQLSFEFVAPERFDAVGIKIGREPCSGDCPLMGTLWIDNIVLGRA